MITTTVSFLTYECCQTRIDGASNDPYRWIATGALGCSRTRGAFSETWNQQVFDEATGEAVRFVQANESVSKAGVLRGLHFQAPPHAQGKLVRVVRGRVLDVAVDLRFGSPTYGQHHAALLSGENRWQYYVPPGFAHGFLALEDDTVFHYQCTALYHPIRNRR